VRRVDADALRDHLQQGAIVLAAPIGFSRTGELFNLYAEQVATEIAIALRAAKLILLGEEHALRDTNNVPIRDLTIAQADTLVQRMQADAPDDERRLAAAIRACGSGVRRTHLLERRVDGALLLELFTRDGVGTMISADLFETTRRATVDDVGGILELIGPLEKQGTLVRRSRERLELEIGDVQVMDRDGAIIACAATHCYSEQSMAELACLAVRSEYRHSARGAALLRAAEMAARACGADALFVLTTQAEHWFVEQGFRRARISDLPIGRQHLYNYQRGAKVLIKSL
jgi:amino-acid N-acetyltransferase